MMMISDSSVMTAVVTATEAVDVPASAASAPASGVLTITHSHTPQIVL